MGGALAHRWLSDPKFNRDEFCVVERDATQRRDFMSANEGVRIVGTFDDLDRSYQSAVIAVKPPHVQDACNALASIGVQRVLSVAAGVRIASMSDWLGGGVDIVRAMPNTPALIGEGVSAIAVDESVSDSQSLLAWAEGLLAPVGDVVHVAERDLDAVTAVSGSGPAYIFLLAEAMISAGVNRGLTHEVSQRLVRATLRGSADLLIARNVEPSELRSQVTSPNGTTAAAVEVLQSKGFAQIVDEAIAAATARSIELGLS